jgi:hypothetical protein
MSMTEKFLRAPGPIEVGGRTLKRYHITTFEDEIESGVQKAAWDMLPELVPQPDDETPPGGWLVAPFGRERSFWVRHILEPDLPDLTGYINDTLPEGRTGGAQ